MITILLVGAFVGFSFFVWSLCVAAATDEIPGVNEPRTYHSNGKKYRK